MSDRCEECYRPIKERAVIAFEKRFHAECFVCAVCKKSFPDGKYVPYKNKPYCRSDYEKLCRKCEKVITSGSTVFSGEMYHIGCLKCSLCRTSLLEGDAYELDGAPYCKSDYQLEMRIHNRDSNNSSTKVKSSDSSQHTGALKAAPSTEGKESQHISSSSSSSSQKCEYCGDPVDGKKLIHGLSVYHGACFKCSSCFNPIPIEEEFSQGKFGILCSNCSRRSCSVCKKVIAPEDNEIEYSGDKMHADCLKCSTCHRVLNPKETYQFRLKTYCLRDYSAARIAK